MKKQKKEKVNNEFYTLDNILSKKCEYNIIFGERSSGKTYACLKYGIERYIKYGEQFAVLRRFKEDTRGQRAINVFSAININNEITILTQGKYTQVSYYGGQWFLANYDEKLDKIVRSDNPIAYSFALSDMEHDKSASFPNVSTIIFDEFLTRQYYLPDEFIIFMNTLSTIIRSRDNVKIFMLGNTVNKYCPYFSEMGLNHVTKMTQGTIDVYTYGQSKVKVAVEYCGSVQKDKPSNKYFAFENPRLEMITGGKWELDIYPHLPQGFKIKQHDIMFTYFVLFDDNILQCEIIQHGTNLFTYIHRKTTPIQNENKDLIYSLSDDIRYNYEKNLLSTTTPLKAKIAYFYKNNKVFYQSNEIGEIIRNYLVNVLKTLK